MAGSADTLNPMMIAVEASARLTSVSVISPVSAVQDIDLDLFAV